MKSFLILLTVFMMMSCAKTNVTFKHHWIAQEGHDIATFNHAVFCAADDYEKIDTVELDNTTAYDSTKFGPHVGSIFFHSRIQVTDTLYDRKYYELKSQID